MKTHGSRVTRGHGMRRGISLIEMLMAIVLLGLLGGISYNYYKVYYDVDFAAKQAKVYVILDQAVQLSGAHDLYSVKNGVEPATIQAMVDDKQLLRIPDKMPEISNTGWVLLPTADVDGSTNTDVVFTYAIDPASTALPSQIDYCNITSDASSLVAWDLSSTGAEIGTASGDFTLAGAYGGGSFGTDIFCYETTSADPADGTMMMVFVKRVDPS